MLGPFITRSRSVTGRTTPLRRRHTDCRPVQMTCIDHWSAIKSSHRMEIRCSRVQLSTQVSVPDGISSHRALPAAFWIHRVSPSPVAVAFRAIAVCVHFCSKTGRAIPPSVNSNWYPNQVPFFYWVRGCSAWLAASGNRRRPQLQAACDSVDASALAVENLHLMFVVARSGHR
jgi:hypothetical protein